RQKNRGRERHSGKSGLGPCAEGVSAADRVPEVRVSQASDRGARTGRMGRPETCCSGEVMAGETLRTLPLEDLHKAAGAKFGGFAGWSMPLTYPAGVMKEHQHTRAHVGLFDISHMKLFLITRPGAAA